MCFFSQSCCWKHVVWRHTTRFSPTAVETGLQLNCTNTVWALNAVASILRPQIRFSFLFTEKELIWSGICCRGPHFLSWFERWWTTIQSGMVRVGCGGRGEVAWIWPTAPPSGLRQQTSVVPLNLLLSIWPFTVHSSQRTGSFDTLVVFNQDLVSSKRQAIVHRN